MAQHPLGQAQFMVNFPAYSITVGEVMNIFYNDANNNIEVEIGGDPVSSGPVLDVYQIGQDFTFAATGHQMCSLITPTTFLEFHTDVDVMRFPYFSKIETLGHSSCAVGSNAAPTLVITGAPAVSNETSSGSSDGSIIVTSSGGIQDISLSTYDNNSFSVKSQEAEPRSVFFSSDGTRMYVLGDDIDQVFEYSLSTAYDLSSAVYSTYSKSVLGEEGLPRGLFFASDGRNFYIVGAQNNTVYQYSIAVAFDLSSSVAYTSKTKDISSQESIPTDLAFSSDGTRMYVVGDSNTIFQYPLSAAWDLASVGDTNKSYIFTDLSFPTAETQLSGISFSNNGKKIYVLISSGEVYQFSLSEAWEVDTITFDNLSIILETADDDVGLFLHPDGTSLFTIDNASSSVYRYTTVVTATEGSVKYGLTDFNYDSEGQSSGEFTDLNTGTYSVYAKDSAGASSVIRVSVLVAGVDDLPAYNALYRTEWKPTPSTTSRVTILDRQFDGSLTAYQSSAASPLRVEYPGGGSIFQTIIGSAAVVGIISTTANQFISLFTQDDKRYLVLWEKDTGGGFQTQWKGFISPSIFSEAWRDAPYTTFINATDGLGSLSSQEFVSDSGDKFHGLMTELQILLICLNKIGLEMGIRSGLNIYEASHDTAATDDPLSQTYIEASAYYDDGKAQKCLEVIDAILGSYGARIFSRDNFWNIVRVEEYGTAAIAYREFTHKGAYTRNSTWTPAVSIETATDTSRVVALPGAQLTMRPANGRVSIISRLHKLKTSVQGDFLDPKFVAMSFINPLRVISNLPGWIVIYSPSGTGVLTFSSRDEISNNLILKDFSSADSYIRTPNLDIDYTAVDELELSFKYVVSVRNEGFMVEQVVTPPYARVKWSLSVNGRWLKSDGTWTDVGAEQKNIIFVSEFNKELGFKLTQALPSTSGLTSSTFQLRLYAVNISDVDTTAASEAVVVSTTKGISTTLLKGRYKHSATDGVYNYYYELVERSTTAAITDGSEEPVLIQPNDYNSSTNLKIWELKDKTSGLGNAFPSVQYSLVDVDFRPGGKEAPKIQTVSVNTRPVFTTLNKVDKKEKLEIFHFDTPAQITNAKNIYNNHLRKSDGSPTKTWKRDTFLTENQTRQDILTSVYVSQTKSPRRKLSGSFLSDVELSPLNVLRDTFDNNRLYVITALTVNDKRREYNISEMIEIFTGDIGSSPGAFNSDFNSDFGTDYSTLLE